MVINMTIKTKQKIDWIILLCEIENNTIKPIGKNPKESGNYLCTCVRMWDNKEVARYLQIMTFDVNKNHWHDIGNPSGISHNILAWTESIKPCDFENFTYLGGGYFGKKE
jgi:hypothetical protein